MNRRGSNEKSAGSTRWPSRSLQPVRAVDRALSILTSLGGADQRPIDLSRTLSLHKVTVARLLASLAHAGMVKRRDDTFYTLGPAIGVLATRLTASHGSLTDVLRGPLRRMLQITHETIVVHVRTEFDRVCVAELESPQAVKYRGGIGRRTPLHAGAAGRIILAFLPPEERAEVLKTARLKKFTDATITNRRRLEAQLERDRRQGYAMSKGECIAGATALSVPVFDSHKNVVAAVSVLGPESRLPPPVAHRYIQILLREVPIIPASVV